MKPYIDPLISSSQTTFILGREISDSIILFREILHSFKQYSYKKEFCLKANLSKAFDRMDWGYIRQILVLYGFPAKFVGWIMESVTKAEFSLVFNGCGDGFFRPECGLRQECALSPYLFILGMDLLSRGLQYMVDSKHIEGVKISPTSTRITNCLYADDLLILEKASVQETYLIMRNLAAFTAIPGQQIGPEKSAIWFSRPTTTEERVQLSALLMVPTGNTATKGSYMTYIS